MPKSNLRIPLYKILLLLATLCILLTSVSAPSVSASQADAANALSSAQNTILNCYEAAKAAEAAGANITVLTKTLNAAGSLLSQAELAYSSGSFDTAVSYAVQSQNKLTDFVAQANNLKQTAVQRQNRDFLINVVGSIAGACAVVAVGAVVWVFLKRKYGTGDVGAPETSAV